MLQHCYNSVGKIDFEHEYKKLIMGSRSENEVQLCQETIESTTNITNVRYSKYISG